MGITAAELIDQRGGTTPRGGRRIAASGIRARRITPIRISEPDVDELPSAPTTEPIITPFVRLGAKGEVLTTKGDKMPSGIYDRTKPRESGEAAAPGEGAVAAPKRKARKAARMKRPRLAKAPAIASQRFGVFEDGSIQISTKACEGNLAPDEVDALRSFLARLEGKKK